MNDHRTNIYKQELEGYYHNNGNRTERTGHDDKNSSSMELDDDF
jgi:hypothetical protein